jgi:hypothetical protein
MEHSDSSKEQIRDRVKSEEALGCCRNHFESLESLSYLISLGADHSIEGRLNKKMMEWLPSQPLRGVISIATQLRGFARAIVSTISAATSSSGM